MVVKRPLEGRALFIIISGYVISILLGIWLWPYSINAWLTFIGKNPIFPWWGGAIFGVIPIFGKLVIPVAAITWLLLMFL